MSHKTRSTKFSFPAKTIIQVKQDSLEGQMAHFAAQSEGSTCEKVAEARHAEKTNCDRLWAASISLFQSLPYVTLVKYYK